MTAKVILWSSEALLKEAQQEGLRVGSTTYMKIDHELVEYIFVEETDNEQLKRQMYHLRYQSIFIVVQSLTKEKTMLLQQLQQEGISFYLFIIESKGEEKENDGARFKHWCYLPVFKQLLFSEMLAQWTAGKKEYQKEALEGGTLLLGKIAGEAKAWPLMEALFKEWHYIESFKHVRLNLYSPLPLALDMLCEVEDAAIEYLSENSQFQLRQHVDKVAESGVYYILEAY